MNVVIINPPLVQLNAPYPAGAYLSAFFKEMNCNPQWFDLSIELFYSIFSKNGLTKLFALSEKNAGKLAQNAEKNNDEATAFNIRRYLSTKENWISWIDFITSTLCNGNSFSSRELEHQFLYSPFAPRGNRMENFLADLEKEPTIDDVRFLCSYALADLADYITAVFDKEFSLIRYAEALTVDESSFADIEKNIDSPVLKEFYHPVLEQYFENLCPATNSASQNKTLVCISIPFAGTFLPALYTAKFLKEKYNQQIFICIGGGFVNTELRDAKEKALAKYIDAISYDRGYGSYQALMTQAPELLKNDGKIFVPEKLYKMRCFIQEDKNVQIIEPLWQNSEIETFEMQMTTNLVPDYSNIDFSKYLRVCDDKNPMHRLWTDGAWIKAYLAHGCYWHKCAFCDTKLDYVCAYKPVETDKLFYGLKKTAEEKKVYGIHFVDEALPSTKLKRFALLNVQNGNKLFYWGNVRFEKSFTKDLAAFLSYCGFGGVSAGLEVATGTGLKNINKGTDIDSIVSACAAFKEAGILVHAYMIYGFWYDNDQSIIDSMETLRQFFAAGLLDSAFWHKFVLTRNSSAYDSLQGRVKKTSVKSSVFASNNVHFEGEEKYNKFGEPLEAALNAWMHGEKLDMKIQKWFNFPVPAPKIDRNFIERAIEKYENKANSEKYDFGKLNPQQKDSQKQIFWLGSKPISLNQEFRWFYLQEEFNYFANNDKTFDIDYFATKILWNLRPAAKTEERTIALQEIKKSPKYQKIIQGLHNQGIVFC